MDLPALPQSDSMNFSENAPSAVSNTLEFV